MTVLVVAIDGPAGAGKSTVSRALAARLSVPYLDTGAMYRAVTLAALRAGIDPGDGPAVAGLAERVSVSISDAAVVLDGNDVTREIRSAEVNSSVSVVAANPAVRREMQRRQRDWAEREGGGVIEGRDIGSVVFPDATLKVFLTASPGERARRRADEIGGDADEILAAIEHRDRLDSSRADSPLVEADGAVVVGTDGLDVDGVVAEIVALLAGLATSEEQR